MGRSWGKKYRLVVRKIRYISVIQSKLTWAIYIIIMMMINISSVSNLHYKSLSSYKKERSTKQLEKNSEHISTKHWQITLDLKSDVINFYKHTHAQHTLHFTGIQMLVCALADSFTGIGNFAVMVMICSSRQPLVHRLHNTRTLPRKH